jgi:hypothetical protein
MAELEGDRLTQRQRSPHYDSEGSRGVGTNGAYLGPDYLNFHIRDRQFLGGIGRASNHGAMNSEGNSGDKLWYQYDHQHCDGDGHAQFESALTGHRNILRRARAGDGLSREIFMQCVPGHTYLLLGRLTMVRADSR